MSLRRFSIFWPLLIMLVAALWLAQSLGGLSGPGVDLAMRAWPSLLVAAGLILLLGRRIRFGNMLAVVLAVVLVGGVYAVAFSQAGTHLANDNHKPFTQVVDPAIKTVKVVINSLATEIDIVPGDSALPAVTGEFVGSKASVINSDYQVDGTNGTFTLDETRASVIPSLESLGRGTLKLSLPVAAQLTQLSVSVTGQSGDVTFDAGGTVLSDLTIQANEGNVTINTLPASLTAMTVVSPAGTVKMGTLPASLATLAITTKGGADSPLDLDASAAALQNLSIAGGASNVTLKVPDKPGLIGDIKTSGTVTITVPPDIAANFKLVGNAVNSPTYNQGDYILNIDKVLVSRRSSQSQMQITVDAAQVTVQ